MSKLKQYFIGFIRCIIEFLLKVLPKEEALATIKRNTPRQKDIIDNRQKSYQSPFDEASGLVCPECSNLIDVDLVKLLKVGQIECSECNLILRPIWEESGDCKETIQRVLSPSYKPPKVV